MSTLPLAVQAHVDPVPAPFEGTARLMLTVMAFLGAENRYGQLILPAHPEDKHPESARYLALILSQDFGLDWFGSMEFARLAEEALKTGNTAVGSIEVGADE